MADVMSSSPGFVPFGHAPLDGARALLKDLADRLQRERQRGAEDGELVSALMSSLLAGAYRYLEFEEAWLQHMGFPNLEAHRREHERIVEALVLASVDALEGRPAAIGHLCETIDRHLMAHILDRNGAHIRYLADRSIVRSGSERPPV